MDTTPAVRTLASSCAWTRGCGTASAFWNSHAVTRPGTFQAPESEGNTNVELSTPPKSGNAPCTGDVHTTPNAINTNNHFNMKTTH